jgi:putative spermidine/putrescine transport system permease protein
VVYNNVLGVASNQPFGAAFALVPVAVMAVYLFAARRLGAFEAL